MSRIEVPMPQMGESIAEGTVSRWLKAPGDAVERDEPILEISTDKVDAEIPSPSSGVLAEVLVPEGETVEVGTIVAYIADSAAANGGAPEPEEAAAEDDVECTTATEERIRTRSTPVVRRIAQEAGVDIASVPGTGHQGRVTKQDILAFIENGGAARAAAPGDGDARPAAQPETAPLAATAPSVPEPASAPTRAAAAPTPAPAARPAAASAPSDLWERFHREVDHPVFPVREGDRVETMDKMRRLTAEHMVLAKRIAPHVHSVIEIDFSTVDRIRAENKARWAERGARVSYTAFVAWACSRILGDFPMVNGVLSGDNIVYRGAVNLGMAVDLNPGLIVPVIHNADDLSLVGIGRRIIDLATRAKSRSLAPSEIQGGTFTITNPGVLGTMVGMPVIPKGTSAILGTGTIDKRVVVVSDPATGADSVGIRKRSFFSLGYDHRLVDGADSARFLSRLKETLESFPDDA